MKRRHGSIIRTAAIGATAAVLATASAACSSDPEQPEALNSGLAITVVRGPINPVEMEGVDNTAPVAGAGLAVVNADGRTLFTASTDANGEARVALPPGSYIVEVRSCPGALPGSALPSSPAAVVAEQFTPVRLECDTGIR